MKINQTIEKMIGNTPLVPIFSGRVARGARVFAKYEGYNLTGSIKDRIVYGIVKDAIRRNLLDENTTVVEGSSGNTGVSLGVICGALGLKCKIFMQSHRSQERVKLMQYFGCEVVLTDAQQAMSHVWEARKFVAENPNHYFLVNQHGNPINWQTHYTYTAAEILDALDRPVDVLISGVGTGGAIVGIGRRLKERNPNCEVVQVEPRGFYTMIQGLLRITGNNRLPEVYDPAVVDQTIEVPEEAAIEYTRYLSKHEGLLCGVSSGAVAWGALQYLERNPNAGTVVCIFGDRLEKYFSTAVFV
jgi:cysteine synthase A